MAWLSILPMRRAVAPLLLLIFVLAFWWWTGRLQELPPAPPVGSPCLSYAPFERGQSPFDENLVIQPEQIERQVRALAKIAPCLRSYSVGQGLDRLPEAAQRAGVQIYLGIWLGRDTTANEFEVTRALELAKEYPQTIRALVVGNEVLLRKEMTFAQLAAILDRVRAASALPITYADVWENWAENPKLAEHVDFATIHILPYWEDEPIGIEGAIAHVVEVRRAVGAELAPLDVLIGETGWPAQGRQREGAVPSPVNQARYLSEILTVLAAEGWHANLIEAIDQDWKRLLEGTVGGHWGLLDNTLDTKFAWGGNLSDHPHWIWQAGLGLLLGFAVLALCGGWRGFALALVSALAVPWWLEQAPIISLDLADWLRNGLAALLGVALPLLGALAMQRDLARPTLASLAGRAPRPRGWLGWSLALGLASSLVLTIPWTLGLVFDPRYRDFTTAAVAPGLAALALLRRGTGPQQAERAIAVVLGLSAAIILVNEKPTNGQSVLWCLTLALFAASLWPRRAGRA